MGISRPLYNLNCITFRKNLQKMGHYDNRPTSFSSFIPSFFIQKCPMAPVPIPNRGEGRCQSKHWSLSTIGLYTRRTPRYFQLPLLLVSSLIRICWRLSNVTFCVYQRVFSHASVGMKTWWAVAWHKHLYRKAEKQLLAWEPSPSHLISHRAGWLIIPRNEMACMPSTNWSLNIPRHSNCC